MPFERVGLVSALPPGEMMEVEAGGQRYAICNVEGEIHAMDGVCPHRNGPLGEGGLHGHMVVCPWHAWEFDCRTGENDRSPDVRVETATVKIDGDDILIEIP